MKRIHAQILLASLFAAALSPWPTGAQAPTEIIIKALIDGSTELHVTTNGLQWKTGDWAKPGRHGKRNEPTHVNEQQWYPKWGKPNEEYGADASDVFPLAIPHLNLDFELLAIGSSASATNMEVRSAPTTSYGANSYIVNIPDPELGSRWYIFALTPRPAATNAPAAPK